MVSSITSVPYVPSHSCSDCEEVARGSDKVQADIAAEISRLGASDAQVSYRYAPGPDGSLQIVEARVTATTEKPQGIQAPAFSEPAQSAVTAPQATRFDGIQVDLQPKDQADLFTLSPEEQAVVRKLQATDISVRRHEAQHFRAAGGLATGTADYTLVQGPDGRYYAVGGSVGVQSSAGADPEQAARDATTLSNAALAPGDASAADVSAANNATQRAASIYAQANDMQEPELSIDFGA